MRRWKQDGAVSPVIGTVVLVCIAIVAAGAVYAVYGSAGGARERPAALAIIQGGERSAEERTFNVATASPGVRYDRITILLAGAPLAYDGDLATYGTWCQETPFGACVADGDFDPASAIDAGDRIRVRAAGFAGETLELRDDVANALLASMELR